MSIGFILEPVPLLEVSVESEAASHAATAPSLGNEWTVKTTDSDIVVELETSPPLMNIERTNIEPEPIIEYPVETRAMSSNAA